ncbi:hypothetical protein [Streptomyces sporangiiformans]|uniref:hypothetical protein n=1 Tax=Streptomyces sporangiiformans TaxID=2315329 RepID=UPI001F08F71A|nr:hypothetical protein [Streptomyces sporangiiformans]
MRTEQAGHGWALDESEGSADGRLLALARQARVVQAPSGHQNRPGNENRPEH